MKTSATNRRIRNILTALNSNTLIPRPEFQRRLVWTNKDKQEFIKTILFGYPFPEIYVASGDVNTKTGESIELLVDGQQRVTAISQYFNGTSDFLLGDIVAYADLCEEKKYAFLEYEVVVRDLGHQTIEEIKHVFTRINSTKYSLSAMEIHNARFDGALKKFAETIAQKDFFDQHRIFKTNDIRRMGDVVYCLTIIISILTAYFNRDDELETFLEQYNDEFKHQDRINREIEKVLCFIDSIGLDSKSRAWKKAELFTLIVEVHRVLFKNKKQLVSKDVNLILSRFYAMVDEASSSGESERKVVEYHRATLQASNDRSNRIRRGEIILGLLSHGLESLSDS